MWGEHHERISCQVMRAKMQLVRMWCSVSGSCEQKTHAGSCGRPQRASLSAVQHRFREASQMKNWIEVGAPVCHARRQYSEEVEPRNNAL